MLTSQSTKLSIIIPAYNEEYRIGSTLRAYLKFFAGKYGSCFEVIVVLNGCLDNTLTVVEKFKKQFKQIKILDFKEKIGKGGAIIEGLKFSQGQLIGYTDADNSTSPEMFYRLVNILELIPSIDCAIGSRNVPGSIVTGKTKSREILSRGFNFGVNVLFRLGIKDTQCGAKISRKKVLKEALPQLMIADMAFDINYLVDIRRKKGNIIEIPITWEDNLDSKINNKLKTSVGMALSVVRLRILYSPFKIFFPIIEPISKMFYNLFR